MRSQSAQGSQGIARSRTEQASVFQARPRSVEALLPRLSMTLKKWGHDPFLLGNDPIFKAVGGDLIVREKCYKTPCFKAPSVCKRVMQSLGIHLLPCWSSILFPFQPARSELWLAGFSRLPFYPLGWEVPLTEIDYRKKLVPFF